MTSSRRTDRILMIVVIAASIVWWTVAAYFDVYAHQMGPFDDGITSGSIVGLLNGQFANIDYYSPYGLLIGLPGALLRLLGIDGLAAESFVYNLGRPLYVALGTAFIWRRYGARAGLVAVVLLGSASVARYTYSFAALFGALLLLDRSARRASAPTLAAIAREQSRGLFAALAVLSLAAWIRVEYAVMPGLFALVLLGFLSGWARVRWFAIASVLALLPTLIVLLFGNPAHMLWWFSYALGGEFQATRGQPIIWSDLRLDNPSARSTVATYGLGALTVLVAALSLLTRRGRRWFVADGTGVRVFAVALCLLLLRAQLARYSSTYGALGFPVFVLPLLLLVGPALQRGSAVRGTGLAAVVLLALMPVWKVNIPRQYKATADAVPAEQRPPARDPVLGMNTVALLSDQWRAWSSAQAEWKRLGLEGRPTTPINRLNELAWANTLMYHRVLDAPQATWLWTYDPGLANQERVQREAARELCANQAPLVQSWADRGAAPPFAPRDANRPKSSYLDEFVALSYQLSSEPMDRILTFRSCILPERASTAQAIGARDRWLKAGQLPEAGSAARVHARRTGAVDRVDVGLLAAAQMTFPRSWISGEGPLQPAIDALTSGIPSAATRRAAVQPGLTWQERYVALHAAITVRTATTNVGGRVLAASRSLAASHPNDLTVADLRGIQPFDPAVVADLDRASNRTSSALAQWWVEGALEIGQPQLALPYWPRLRADFTQLGRLTKLGDLGVRLGSALAPSSPGCANTLLRETDALPGTKLPTPPPDPGNCPELREQR